MNSNEKSNIKISRVNNNIRSDYILSSNKILSKKIEELAYEISQKHLTYDQFVWKLAKNTLKLENGSEPDLDLIRNIAQAIINQHLSLEELHWTIAEKILLYKNKFENQ